MSAQPEVWRVSTVEGIFETDLETLKQWIAEGCVLPTDKVSKGSLNWIDAGRAPMLRAAFAGDFSPQPPKQPPAPETFAGWQAPPPSEETVAEPAATHSTYDHAQDHGPSVNEPSASTSGVCQNHPDAPAYYICRVCSATWCRTCPRFVSDKIPLCASCGDLCKLYQDVAQKIAQSQFQASGFGFGDFATAIQYPLNHKVALLTGALIYGVLLIGGFWASLVAGMIMFGCVSHAISQVAWGRLHRSFMPDFSEFHPWDDLVMPIFLGLGITIVTWGPVIALVLALLFGLVQGPGLPSVVPGHEMAASAEPVGPTPDQFKDLLDPNADPKKLEEANKKLQQLRPGAEIAREAERSKKENEPGAGLQMLLPFLGAGLLLLGLLVLGIAWAIFYKPMALTVAGYTQSLGAVLNPLVGLDTIRRMGSTYFKAFGMVLIVDAVSLVVGVVIAVVTSAFNMPFVGNLPGNLLSGAAMFYFNLVIACLLGLSLFKCADRLGISVD